MKNPIIVAFRNTDLYIAIGKDPWKLPVYQIHEYEDGNRLGYTKMFCPSCLKFMPYAEGIWDRAKASYKQIRKKFNIVSPLPPPSPYRARLIYELRGVVKNAEHLSIKELIQTLEDKGRLDWFYESHPMYDPKSPEYDGWLFRHKEWIELSGQESDLDFVPGQGDGGKHRQNAIRVADSEYIVPPDEVFKKSFSPFKARLMDRVENAGKQDWWNFTIAEALDYLEEKGELKEFYAAFPSYDPKNRVSRNHRRQQRRRRRQSRQSS